MGLGFKVEGLTHFNATVCPPPARGGAEGGGGGTSGKGLNVGYKAYGFGFPGYRLLVTAYRSERVLRVLRGLKWLRFLI